MVFFSDGGSQQSNNCNNQQTESCSTNIHNSNMRNSVTNVVKSTNTDSVSSSKPPKPKQKYLHCVSCNSPFSNAWDLMVHVQAAHMMNIYQLADSNKLQQKVGNEFLILILQT